ncbi:hypothetical protein E6H31_01760 [Candidatus Bathyarchaeota archaeon]|nr:MAG: hypothetical protein E6H31_01760 [Candidatus Bathyarchaeota archaeon]
MVNVIESARVLKTEFFSVRLEARPSMPPIDLRIEVRSAKDVTIESDPPKPLNSELRAVRLDARFPIVPVGF